MQRSARGSSVFATGTSGAAIFALDVRINVTGHRFIFAAGARITRITNAVPECIALLKGVRHSLLASVTWETLIANDPVVWVLTCPTVPTVRAKAQLTAWNAFVALEVPLVEPPVREALETRMARVAVGAMFHAGLA